MAGRPVHFEIPATDTAKGRAFWSGMFGWEFESFPGPVEYHTTRVTDESGAAVYNNPEGNADGIRVYFDVDDINAGIARVKELGGQASDAMPVPTMGWFSTCTDVSGNEFGLWQTDPNAAM